MPPLSASKTEITKVLAQYSSVMGCVNTTIFRILALVLCLCTCKFVVVNKTRLLTHISDTQRGGIKISTVLPVQEITSSAVSYPPMSASLICIVRRSRWVAPKINQEQGSNRNE